MTPAMRRCLKKLVKHAMSPAVRSLQGAAGTSFWAPPRKTTDRQGSIRGKRVYTPRRRMPKSEFRA